MLKLEQVSKLYRNNHGLQKTSITFQEGQITGILGRNGSGKTTLLKAILNLVPTFLLTEMPKRFLSL